MFVQALKISPGGSKDSQKVEADKTRRRKKRGLVGFDRRSASDVCWGQSRSLGLPIRLLLLVELQPLLALLSVLGIDVELDRFLLPFAGLGKFTKFGVGGGKSTRLLASFHSLNSHEWVARSIAFLPSRCFGSGQVAHNQARLLNAKVQFGSSRLHRLKKLVSIFSSSAEFCNSLLNLEK